MNYLLDKKTKKKKFSKIALGVFFLIILIYFRSGVSGGLSLLSHTVFRPALVAGNTLGEKFTNLGAYFTSKYSLFLENKILKTQVISEETRMANYTSLLAENEDLKEILKRKKETTSMILGAILAKPNQSPYDTLVIDVGEKQGIKTQSLVFAQGNIPIGRIAETYPNSSKVVLFSSSGEKMQAILSSKNIFMELIGRGGGNFEMVIPRDLALEKGEQLVMIGISPYLLAVVETIISDPRDSFIKALLVSPVNIQEIKFVEVELSPFTISQQ